MNSFSDKVREFLSDFGKGRKMVLSTSENNIVSSRMMSVVQIEGIFYFQTDTNMKKYHHITANNNI
ncbi:MAG: pyridoxamine 5'-phosphate oxidase family protein, partial [Ruminiclostridium sp.]